MLPEIQRQRLGNKSRGWKLGTTKKNNQVRSLHVLECGDKFHDSAVWVVSPSCQHCICRVRCGTKTNFISTFEPKPVCKPPPVKSKGVIKDVQLIAKSSSDVGGKVVDVLPPGR